MKNIKTNCVAALMCFGVMGAAVAADFSVGRAKLKMPGEGWLELTALSPESKKYDGDASGDIKSTAKVFVKEAADKSVQAVVIVTGNAGSMSSSGYLVYNPSCKSTENWLGLGNEGINTHYLDCLRVLRVFSARSVLQSLAPDALKVIDAEKVRLPQNLQTFLTYYASSNGTFLDVRVFADPSFTGRAGTLSDKIKTDYNPAMVLWGQELATAAASSVKSLFGGFEFPSMEFAK